MRSFGKLLGSKLLGSSLTSTRMFGYAALLGLSMFTIQPTLASAEDAHGKFTLSHEVHWQNVVLRPGEYTFSVKSVGPSEFLVVQGVGTGTDAMMMVNDVDSVKSDASKLVLVSRDGHSFVSTMALPAYDMTLHFAVPSESASK
jgi:hypothetical protein